MSGLILMTRLRKNDFLEAFFDSCVLTESHLNCPNKHCVEKCRQKLIYNVNSAPSLKRLVE